MNYNFVVPKNLIFVIKFMSGPLRTHGRHHEDRADPDERRVDLNRGKILSEVTGNSVTDFAVGWIVDRPLLDLAIFVLASKKYTACREITIARTRLSAKCVEASSVSVRRKTKTAVHQGK